MGHKDDIYVTPKIDGHKNGTRARVEDGNISGLQHNSILNCARDSESNSFNQINTQGSVVSIHRRGHIHNINCTCMGLTSDTSATDNLLGPKHGPSVGAEDGFYNLKHFQTHGPSGTHIRRGLLQLPSCHNRGFNLDTSASHNQAAAHGTNRTSPNN